MPELPDILIYLEALQQRIVGEQLVHIRVKSPFVVRTFEPCLDSLEGRKVSALRRLGKRIAVGFDDELWLVLHLMIAGRLQWRPPGAKTSGKNHLVAFDFPRGTLLLTEAGSKRRASIHVVRGEDGLAQHDRGGIDVFGASLADFQASLKLRNRTIKRALTDPSLFDGIGNAYADEILHRARLSPLGLTQKLSSEDVSRLYQAARGVLQEWIVRLRELSGGEFPEHVTAFRPEMAVHGRFGQPCPVCGATVQRIRYAENETNYCPNCQTNGRILADRSLSRLLKDDWPRHAEEL